jgi:hypothetical protein
MLKWGEHMLEGLLLSAAIAVCVLLPLLFLSGCSFTPAEIV